MSSKNIWTVISGMPNQRTTCLAAAFLALVCAAAEARAAESRNVLMLYSFGADIAPWSETNAIFRAEMNKRQADPIEIYQTSVFGMRFDGPREQVEGRLVEYLRELFSTRKLALVVSFGAPAAHFIQQHRLDLFAGVP